MTEKNILFPGRPDYEGPADGYFAFLHHDLLYEKSNNVMERVEYVKTEKPKGEVEIRLNNMIYLPFMTDAIDAGRRAERDAIYAKWQSERNALDAKWRPEQDAIYTKWQSERNALDAKWRPEQDAVDAGRRSEQDAIDIKWWPERDAIDARWRSERDAINARWRPEQDAVNAKWRAEQDAVDARRRTEQDAVDGRILTFVKKHIPDCAWDGKELVFGGENE